MVAGSISTSPPEVACSTQWRHTATTSLMQSEGRRELSALPSPLLKWETEAQRKTDEARWSLRCHVLLPSRTDLHPPYLLRLPET
jgi:hypothetical protein